MQYVLFGGAALLGLMFLLQMLRRVKTRTFARGARWLIGGLLAALSAFLIIRGQIGIATLTGPLAFMILRYGRIGKFTFEGTTLSEDNASAVKSRFISMTLDHSSGSVEGRVLSGAFKGCNLIDLNEDQTRQLLGEVGVDPDSLALLETWLDKNRDGWREYFAGKEPSGNASNDNTPVDLDSEAYEVLGLKPGATEEEIRAAHRKLMMGVHPDQGGSNYLASKINAAKDRLLRRLKS